MIWTALAFITALAQADVTNDSIFFDQLNHGEVVAYAACREGNDVRALIFSKSISNPDFVELVNGHVARMAHVEISGVTLKVVDANGGIWTYEKIHDMAQSLMTSNLKLSQSDDIKKILTDEASVHSCEKAADGALK